MSQSYVIRLVFVRHGETVANRAGVLQGQSDYPLTPEGVVMASDLGVVLGREKWDSIYSSDCEYKNSQEDRACALLSSLISHLSSLFSRLFFSSFSLFSRLFFSSLFFSLFFSLLFSLFLLFSSLSRFCTSYLLLNAYTPAFSVTVPYI